MFREFIRRCSCLAMLLIMILNISGCNLFTKSIAKEYSKETYITIEKVPEDSVSSINMSIVNSEDGSVILERNDSSSGNYDFKITKDSLPEGTDYSKLKVSFTIVDTDGNLCDVNGDYGTFEFGTDYSYELVTSDGEYMLQGINYPER